jgi:hypothetical protein
MRGGGEMGCSRTVSEYPGYPGAVLASGTSSKVFPCLMFSSSFALSLISIVAVGMARFSPGRHVPAVLCEVGRWGPHMHHDHCRDRVPQGWAIAAAAFNDPFVPRDVSPSLQGLVQRGLPRAGDRVCCAAM